MILVTGSTGFVGRAVIEYLASTTYKVRACSRQENIEFLSGVESLVTGELSEDTDWKDALEGISVVIHLAAKVHVMHDGVAGSLLEFRKINTAGTLKLARQAADIGVKRFIFVSTIKVNGETTETDTAFSPDDIVSPTDPYAISKYEAEQGLIALAKETGMEVVIIRPPLIYGPGVKANFKDIMKWVSLGIPLSFGTIHNQRSLIALDNLVSFIICCIDNPKAANEIFLISDCEDVSTTQLIQKMAKAYGHSSKLIPVPSVLLKFFAKLLGKDDIVKRLLSSLRVDSSKATKLLDWRPVVTMDEQLKKLAATSKK